MTKKVRITLVKKVPYYGRKWHIARAKKEDDIPFDFHGFCGIEIRAHSIPSWDEREVTCYESEVCARCLDRYRQYRLRHDYGVIPTIEV